jgi:hypothetical protein
MARTSFFTHKELAGLSDGYARIRREWERRSI